MNDDFCVTLDYAAKCLWPERLQNELGFDSFLYLRLNNFHLSVRECGFGDIASIANPDGFVSLNIFRTTDTSFRRLTYTITVRPKRVFFFAKALSVFMRSVPFNYSDEEAAAVFERFLESNDFPDGFHWPDTYANTDLALLA